MTTVPPIFVVIVTFGLLFVILNTFVLGMSLQVGHLIAHFLQNWKLALCVIAINFILIPALVIGFAMFVASSVPTEVKVGFCVVALAAGAPFAPIFTRLAKADVATSASLMIVLMVLTVIVLPLALPAATSTVDPDLKVSAWDIAWPLLAFFLPSLIVGILVRLRWPDVAREGIHLLGPIALLCLLVHVTLYFYAAWSAFVDAWGTVTYLAAIAIPFIGILSGYVLASILRLKDVGARHATEITTGQRNVSASILMCIVPFFAYPLVSVSVLSASMIGIIVLLVFSMEWGRAVAQTEPAVATAQTAASGKDGVMTAV
jgi:bile acid:Na+ symporter, BASS family